MLASWYAPEWIVIPMKGLLEWFYGISGSYGLAIILLTVAVRVVILPLTIYQMRSMKKMQEVQPLMKELQDKYKEQPEKLNAEMMTLYKTQGVNPFAGCLPLLIQMPFLYAVFAVLRALQLNGVLFLGIDLGVRSIPLAVLTVVSMFAQSWLGGAGTDPNQKMMVYLMPLLFGYITFTMPAGVVLYWVISTVFGIAQQAIYPGFPRLKGTPGTAGGAGAK